MDSLANPTELATPFFVALIILEMIYGRISGRTHFEPRDTATSMFMGFGSVIAGAATAGMVVASAVYVYQYRVFNIDFVWWAFVLCFVLDDLAYYVFHRAGHRIRWFWASHVIHHTSRHYNLSTALRQTWTGTIALAFIFRLPLFFIGFPPEMVFFVVGLNLVYQFWIHTEAIDTLGPFEWILNTPSHHRVHHATNPKYLDSNYAGALIIWDRLFGTFVPEDKNEPCQYGVVYNIATYNPLRVAFHEWGAMVRDIISAQSIRDVLGYIFAPPGWSPDGSRMTTDKIKEKWRKDLKQGMKEVEPAE